MTDDFVKRHSAAVLALAKRMVPPEYVEDCYQAGLLTLVEASQSPSAISPTWWPRLSVIRDIQREAANLRGRPENESFEELQETAEYDDSEIDLAMVGNDRNEELESSQCREQLADLVGHLPEGHAKNILYEVLEGHTVSEAARNLGLSQSTADRLYQNTVASLRRRAGNFA